MNMFSADSKILDGEVFDWDGDRFLVRLYPSEAGQIEVRVTMLDDTGASTFTYWVKRCRPDELNECVWDCINECQAMEINDREYYARLNRSDFDLRR
jgi:hypothetical protein